MTTAISTLVASRDGAPAAASPQVSAVAPVVAKAAVPAPAPTPFTGRLVAGLSGVLLAVLVAGFNEHVTDVELTDIRGVMGISHDEGTWITALYEAFEIAAMAFAPWLGVTFSIRQLTMVMMATFAVLGALAPFAPDLPSLCLLRIVQGFAGGCMPPMLMTVALRYLPPKMKVYGLGAYALTATFGPNLGTPLGAFCFEYLGWRSVFWECIPFSLLAIALIGYGLPQDPLRLERFRQLDWRGFLLGLPAICMLVIGLMQGDRLDWFRSPVIVHLLVGGTFLFTLFAINEWYHPLPFFRIQMLRSRNISFGLFAISGVLILAAVNSAIPSLFLAEIRLYRPLQTAPLMLLGLALPQLAALLIVSFLCNLPRVDCRFVMAGGLALIGLSFFLGSSLTSDWYRGNFYLLEAIQVMAQPMIIIPILMLVTMSIAPTDGPFISGMFNMTKGFASAVALATIESLMTWREHIHSNILLDHLGANRFTLQTILNQPSLVGYGADARAQAVVLAAADVYLLMVGFVAVMLLLNLVLPTRVYAPSTALARAPTTR